MDESLAAQAAPLAVAVFAGALAFLAAVFVLLYLRTGRGYLGRAAVFFGLLVPSYVVPLVLKPPPDAPEPRGLLLGMVLATWMLLRAGAELTATELSPWWRRLVGAVALVLGLALVIPGLLPGAMERSMVAHLAIVPCGLGAAFCLWRHAEGRAAEYRVASAVTVVAFLHSGLHPVTPWLGWYGLVGWVVETALIALMGAAFLMAHFQKLRDELGESEGRLRSFFDAATDLVLVVAFPEGRSGRILEANPGAQRLLGLSLAELRCRTARELAAPGHESEMAEVEGRLAREGSATCEAPLLTSAGEVLRLETACRTVVLDGEPALLVVGRDLTARLRAEDERRRLEAELQRGRRFDSLAVLAGGLAHDFNNLLAAILGSVDLALMEVEPGSSLGEDLGRIRRAGQRSSELTRQLLAASGKGDVRLTRVDVGRALAETLHLLTVAGRLAGPVKVGEEGAGLTALTDEGGLRDVVVALLLNSSEALTPGEGSVEVRLDRVGPDVRIRVVDTGAGMDEETLARAFEPFFSTKPACRGLGLSSATGLLRRMGGSLTLESARGVGTTATVLLPAAEPVQDEPATTAGPAPRGLVLVADDEPDLRDVTRLFLETDGWSVLEAPGGQAALAVLRERSDLSAMVLDWKMPDLSGDGVLKAMVTEGLLTPVVLMSGYSEGEASAAVGDGGQVVTFLQKPFLRSDLLAAVASAASTRWPREGSPA